MLYKIIIYIEDDKDRSVHTFIELSAAELMRTGSLAKKWRDAIEASWASLITDWSFLFLRFHMFITPDEHPEAKKGWPSDWQITEMKNVF